MIYQIIVITITILIRIELKYILQYYQVASLIFYVAVLL